MFFVRAFRLFAYRGVMRQELEIEQANNAEREVYRPEPSAPPPPPAHSDPGGTRWVSPHEMKALFPDMF